MLARCLCVLLLICAIPPQTPATVYDLMIRDARVVDGTGAQPFSADVLIAGDRIAFIGRAPADARATRTIDAAGRVLAPGFIDAHAHGRSTDTFENELAMGVTTIVLGQDGSSPDGVVIEPAPGKTTFADWLARGITSPPAVNIAPLIGFGSVRDEAGAPYNAPASAAQIQRLSALLDRGLSQGAFGVSLGMEYVPMISATAEELAAVAAVAGAHDGIVMSHLRSEDNDQIARAIDELLAMGRHARVQVSHIKIVYGKTAAEADAVLKQLADARARGIRVTADVYPYLASQTGLAILFPDWAKARADFERARHERRAELASYLQERVMKRGGPEATLLSTGRYTGMTLAELSMQMHKSFVDLLIDDLGPDGASADYFVMNAAVQDRFVMAPGTMIGTDGSPGMHHPRAFGTYARLIETYVGKMGLPLPVAVRKMTALAAEVLKLSDRGLIKQGDKADLVLFDPARVHETATWVNPEQLATGFEVVIVNGKIAREGSQMAPGRFGRVLTSTGSGH